MIDILTLVFWIFVFAIYFYPTSNAYCKKKKNRQAIFAVNFLTGWTFAGWIFAYVWSLCED